MEHPNANAKNIKLTTDDFPLPGQLFNTDCRGFKQKKKIDFSGLDYCFFDNNINITDIAEDVGFPTTKNNIELLNKFKNTNE
jgi:hypothetical protein